MNRSIFVRGGYKLNYDIHSYTLGAGFRANISGAQYELNYAFAPAGEDMGQTHRVSLSVRFGYPLLNPGEEYKE